MNKTVQRQNSTVEARDGRLLYLGTSHQARVHANVHNNTRVGGWVPRASEPPESENLDLKQGRALRAVDLVSLTKSCGG